ncbi:hypothetical protein SELMODRAFT_414778 [Selaginella moellendorffii]|uniref:Uncharacterized protein n=1 Tax=Selaginella moellendorffii TaxID=88036 RepID=D8RUK9_SELML|nr:hypothetical protein SELMODRAFT_414778 [Selaginella moellendorffii]
MGGSKENCGEHEVVGLFAVKKDEKVTWLFLELFSGMFEKCGCNMRDLVEVAIWLGDEETVRSLVKCTRSGFGWRMLVRLGRGGGGSLIERGKAWDDARNVLERVIDVRVGYLSGEEGVIWEDKSNDEQMPEAGVEYVVGACII